MGKRRLGERQDVILITEAGNVAEMKLEVDIGFVESPNTPEAWGLNRTQQALRLSTGRFVQLISERSGVPIQVFRNGGSSTSIIGDDISTIARQAEDRAQQESEKGRPKDSRILWLGIVAGLVTIGFLALILKVVM